LRRWGLGLPQFNAVNKELRNRVDGQFGVGYDYAYSFP
jgi:DNA excision repair protein ERCC-2